MSITAAEFKSLLSEARKGDQQALSRITRQYEDEIRLVARFRMGRLLRPYLDSVDVVQSVHRSLMAGLKNEQFDIATPENLVALASTIVRRKVAAQWRKLRRQQRLDEGIQSSESLPYLLQSLASGEDDPAKNAEIRDQIARFLAEMNEKERQVIELRLEGFSTADVARRLGLDADVLRVQLSRLRRRLRQRGLLNDWL